MVFVTASVAAALGYFYGLKGGNDIHSNGLNENMAISFSASSAVLEAALLVQIVRRNSERSLKFVRFWLGLFASALTLCGIFLISSSYWLAAATVTAGIMELFGLYGVLLMLKHNRSVLRLTVDFALVRWSNPTPFQTDAIISIQAAFRSHLARTRMIRLRELNIWLLECRREREALAALAYLGLAINTLGLLYCNLIFGVKFDDTTANGWLVTCFLSLCIEAFIQQPVVLLVVSVMGDFVEVLGSWVLEVVAG
ncbi:unnamed protein product [Chrysoparadoxa australica]